ncbi:MAG: peptidyl-prolyl cis-trans isomerase [Pseudomonadota bacterium]
MSNFLLKKYITRALLILISIIGLGCALYSVFPEGSSVVAIINNDSIDTEAFQKKIRNIHKLKPMGETSGINIQDVVENMINDRLIIQEAYRVKLDEDPLLQEKVNKYIKIRSVIRLRKEEVDDKISATEEELREYFNTYYEEIKVRQIVTKDLKKAEEILQTLRSGADFIDIAKAKSEWGNEQGGDLGFIKRGKMDKAFEKVAFALKAGEISDIVKTDSGFHIIRLDERKSAPEDMFENAKKGIRKKLLKGKEAKRSDDYLAELRDKAEIWIDTELLYSLDPMARDCDANVIIARVNKRPITACDFMEDASQRIHKQGKRQRNIEKPERLHQEIVDSLITYELVEEEALGRNYINDPPFKKDIQEYKENLLIKFFQQEIILPRAIPTEEELKEYYETHKDDFRKDYEVWFGEIVFSTSDAAEAVLKELKMGADFAFMASKESLTTPRTGVNVWIPVGSLSIPLREAIKTLEIGGISEVIQDSRQFKVLKLKGKRGGEHKEFARVVDRTRQIVVKKKFNEWLQEYLNELKRVSSIHINKKLLNELYTKGIN